MDNIIRYKLNNAKADLRDLKKLLTQKQYDPFFTDEERCATAFKVAEAIRTLRDALVLHEVDES